MSVVPLGDPQSTPAANVAPLPTWRTRTANWVFGLWLPDLILRRHAANLVERLHVVRHLRPGGIYIDIGSGTGHVPVCLAEATTGQGAKFVGVEPVSKPTRRVRRRLRGIRNACVLFTRAVGQCLPLGDHIVDGGSVFFVLHHIPYPQQIDVLAEIKRVLKPGGLLVVWEDTPEDDREYHVTETWDRRLNFESAGERHYYRRGDDWVRLLAEQGFEPIERAYFEHHSHQRRKGPIRHSGYLLRFRPVTDRNMPSHGS